jgi:hypothetical protein
VTPVKLSVAIRITRFVIFFFVFISADSLKSSTVRSVMQTPGTDEVTSKYILQRYAMY